MLHRWTQRKQRPAQDDGEPNEREPEVNGAAIHRGRPSFDSALNTSENCPSRLGIGTRLS